MLKTNLSEELYQYALQVGVKEPPILTELRLATAKLTTAHMQISPDQGQFMGWLAKLVGAQKYLEIGVFTGYSSLVMALSMGKSGSVFALENNEAHLAIAESFWLKAGVHDQIKVFKHNALDSLAQLVNEQYSNSFDIAFIDANKADYLSYYNYCYQLVKPGGIILIDNVLFHGRVLEANPPKYVRAIQEFNHYIYQDKRVEISVLAIADGLTLAYKKKDA